MQSENLGPNTLGSGQETTHEHLYSPGYNQDQPSQYQNISQIGQYLSQHQQEFRENVHYQTKGVSSFKRLLALTIVQWHLQRKKYLQHCCLIFFPVLIMILPIFLSIIAFSRKFWGGDDTPARFYYTKSDLYYYPCSCIPGTNMCVSFDAPTVLRFSGFLSDFLFKDSTPAGDDALISTFEKTGEGFWYADDRYATSHNFQESSMCVYGPNYLKYNGSSEIEAVIYEAARNVYDCSGGSGFQFFPKRECMQPEFVGHGIEAKRIKSSELKLDVDIFSNSPRVAIHFIYKNMMRMIGREDSPLFPKYEDLSYVLDRESPLTALSTLSDTTILLVYPIVISFLFPLFLSSYIQDRNLGILSFIQLFGVAEWEESFVRFCSDMIFFLAYSGVNFIFCLLAQMIVFQKSFWMVMLSNLVYGYIQIHAAYTISPLFKNASQSSPIGYLIIGFFCAVGPLLNIALFDSVSLPPWWYLIFPPFTYIRCFSLAIMNSSELNFIRPGLGQFFICLAILIAQAILFTFTAYGLLTRFPKYIYHLLRRKYNDWRYTPNEEVNPLLQDESSDVKQERNAILNNEIDEDVILVANGLCKVFGRGKSKKVAVNHLYVTMSRGQCFGLIGSNGSGKTTTISMITGMLKPTSGSATVCGYDIANEMSRVKKCIGVLPQFEILWPTLTVEEHLYFYSRLRGVPYTDQKEHIKAILSEIGLEEARRRNAKNLSGGMRRRLGLAIALTGSPPLLLLDEPSSGLDAASARGMWDLILQAKKSRCVVLTSHSMHEVETLCERIGMLANGNLVCVGDLLDLKKNYTDGYKLKISCDIHNTKRALEYIKKNVPFAEYVQDLGAGNLLFRIKSSTMKLPSLFSNMQYSKLAQFGIRDWNLDQASLDEIFMKFSSGHDDV